LDVYYTQSGNEIHEEVRRRRINVRSACYYSVQNYYIPFTLQNAENQDIQDS
jgi:hypothetical protein